MFNYFLTRANFSDQEFNGEIVERGSFIVSVKRIQNDTKLTRSVVRNIIQKLTTSGAIVVQKTTNKYHKISICNYEIYASDQRANNHNSTTTQPEVNQNSTTSKEYKIEDNTKKKNNKKKNSDVVDEEKQAYGEFQNVFLKPEEYHKLIHGWKKDSGYRYEEYLNEYGIEPVGRYLRNTTKKYPCHYSILQGWPYKQFLEAMQKNNQREEIII